MKKIAFLFLCFNLIAYGQSMNSWTKKETFAGGKRERAVGFAIGDSGYVATGEDTVSWTHNDLWRYDPVSDTWAQKMSIPGSTRRNASGVTINGKGYVGLGIDSSSAFTGTILDDWWEYDASANNWTQKADYPGGYDVLNNTNSFEGVYYATAFEINGKGYVCGGKMGSDFYATDLWEYDPTLDQWTRKADFPGGDRYQLSGLGLEGKGYVGLGVDHDLFRKDWWEYDPNLNTWTQKSNLPGVERGAASTFVLGQRGFVVFGSDGGYKDELWEYNPFSDSWMIRANFPGGERKNAITFTIGNRAYAGLGKGPTGLRRNFYEYAPMLPVGTDEFFLSTKLYPNPASTQTVLSISDWSQAYQVILYTASGQEVKRLNIEGETTIIQLDGLTEGIYALTVIGHQQNPLSQQKICIQ